MADDQNMPADETAKEELEIPATGETTTELPAAPEAEAIEE